MRKVVLGIVGCGLFVGVIAHFIFKQANLFYTKTKTDKEYTPSDTEDTESTNIDISESRIKAASTIYERHQGASEYIKESMERIFSADEKVGMHAEELNDISDELDELLKEND